MDGRAEWLEGEEIEEKVIAAQLMVQVWRIVSREQR